MRAVLSLILLFASSAFLQANPTIDWAKSDLDKSRKSAIEVGAKIESERAAMAEKLKSLRERSTRASELLKSQNEKRSGMVSLGEKSKFYDSVSGELSGDISSMLASFGIFEDKKGSILSLNENLNRMGEAFAKADERLFKGEWFGEARPVKSTYKVRGKVWRIGAFTYFKPEGNSQSAYFLSSDGAFYGEKFSHEIADFEKNPMKNFPADISNGLIAESEKISRTFGEDIVLGGIWMWPILFFGALSALVFIVKIVRFSIIRRAPKNLAQKILRLLKNGDDVAALSAAKSASWPYNAMMLEMVRSRNLDSSMLEEISYEYMLTAGEKLFSGLAILSVSAAVSPLFGLLGTVTGIIKTFGDLSFHGVAQSQFISAGISEALITTEYGLIVAIPAFVAHALLSRRAKAVLSDMEKLASAFVGGNYKK